MSEHALMSLDDRVLHVATDTPGIALCGERVRTPFREGLFLEISEMAESPCLDCMHIPPNRGWGA